MMMGFAVKGSRCVTILLAATLLSYNIQICGANDGKLFYGETPEVFSNIPWNFGDENINVYIEHRSKTSEAVRYEKLDNGIEKAMDHWETIKETSLKTRKRRDVEEIHDYEKIKEMSETLVNTYRSKRYVSNVTFYPTVLTILDYATDWPTNENDTERVMSEQILYALTFWNGVDLQLRHIPHPKVSLRLGGIIICYKGNPATFIDRNKWDGAVNVRSSLKKAQDYFAFLAKGHDEFSGKAAHFVAVLTHHMPRQPSDAISTSYGFCDDSVSQYHLPVTVITDNHAFDGLQLAVQQVAKLMGVTMYDNGERKGALYCVDERFTIMTDDVRYRGRKWSQCSLKQLECGIDARSCLRTPKIYNTPGRPLERILPGRFYRALEQCKAYGLNPGFVCWKDLSCQKLVCAKSDSWRDRCIRFEPPLDGTTCGSGKLCLDGKCVYDPLHLCI